MGKKQRKVAAELITGPMFSGKSTELLLRYTQACHSGHMCQIFKPSLDTRYAQHEVVTHNGERASCTQVNQPRDILELVHPRTTVVAIDEAQLFNDTSELVKVVGTLVWSGKRVIIAGLDLDKWCIPFAWVDALGHQAERTILVARCAVCNQPARFTQYLSGKNIALKDSQRIDIGGAERYEPRCEMCHRQRKGVSLPVRFQKDALIEVVRDSIKKRFTRLVESK